MILVIALAALAAASVVAYSRWRDLQPEMAEQSTKRAEQLAGVTLVLARAVAGIAEAMALTQPRVEVSRSQRLMDLPWDEEEYR